MRDTCEEGRVNKDIQSGRATSKGAYRCRVRGEASRIKTRVNAMGKTKWNMHITCLRISGVVTDRQAGIAFTKGKHMGTYWNLKEDQCQTFQTDD